MTSRRTTTIHFRRTIVALVSLASTAWGQAAPDPLPAPGRLLDVGGHRLHVHCVGQGTPTVVIDGGAGTWSIHYSHIQAALAGEVRVCTYDRGGLGWSDPGPAPRTSGRMVDELHQVLHAAGAAPPLLLVGHSLGGYNVRIYQSRYPEEVGGLVLVDAAHPNQWDRLPPEWAEAVRAEVGWLRSQAERARQGKIVAADVRAGGFTKHAPQWRETHIAAQLTPKPYKGLALETESVFVGATQVPSGSVGSLPLVVLTARRSFDRFASSGLDTNEPNKVWQELQHELARLSTNVTHVFSERDHALHETDPQSVVDAIRQGIAKVRAASAPAPAALGLRPGMLAPASDPEVDGLLTRLEHAYRAMDADGFVGLFTDDVMQLDVNRRVHVRGREQWAAWTRDINAAHRRMNRQHRGRARVGDWVLVEVEWSGTVRGDALSEPGQDTDYRYTGLALLRVRGGKIAEQVLYIDYATLAEQLAAGRGK
jgi:pimeloyl-ACP methyl ester carboxylesterase/ketosteroid isomerase-like protein